MKASKRFKRMFKGEDNNDHEMIFGYTGSALEDIEIMEATPEVASKSSRALTRTTRIVNNNSIRCGSGYKGADCNRCKYATQACPKIKVVVKKRKGKDEVHNDVNIQ